jgi:hypothetical protein
MGEEAQLSLVIDWISSLVIITPRIHIGSRWILLVLFLPRQFYPVETPLALIRYEARWLPEPSDVMWWLCVLRYGASLSATRSLDLIVLWHRMWVAAWERHDGRQAVVVTRFLIPRRRQLRRVCMYLSQSDCVSVCLPASSSTAATGSIHFLAQIRSAEWTNTTYSLYYAR